jgi:hypothetical protein
LHLHHEFLSGYRVRSYIQVIEVGGMEYCFFLKKKINEHQWEARS